MIRRSWYQHKDWIGISGNFLYTLHWELGLVRNYHLVDDDLKGRRLDSRGN